MPNNDELNNALKRAIMAQVTILVIERLRKKWGLKGGGSWNAGGVSITKDVTNYEELYKDAEQELAKYVSRIKPFIGRTIKTGRGHGSYAYDNNVAWSDQVLSRNRIGRGLSYRW